MRRDVSGVFLTLSPSEAYTLDQENQILDFLTSFVKSFYLVREYGKTGNHPHLHAVALFNQPHRLDSFKRSMKASCKFLTGSHEYRAKQLIDTPQVCIARYLVKDPNHHILYSDYDLSTLPAIPDHIHGTLIGKRILSVNEAPYVIVEYCNLTGNEIPDTADKLYPIFRAMYHDGYVITAVLRNLKVVIVLLRMSSDVGCPHDFLLFNLLKEENYI